VRGKGALAIIIKMLTAILRATWPYLLAMFTTIWYSIVILTKSLLPSIPKMIYALQSLPQRFSGEPIFMLAFAGCLASMIASIIMSVMSYMAAEKPVISEKPKKIEVEVEVEVIPLKRRFALFLSGLPIFRPVRDRFSDWIERDMQIAGVYENPYYLAGLYLVISVLSIVILAPLSIYLAIQINPFFSTLMAVPLLFLLMPKVNLKIKRGERRGAVEDELPFFTAYSMIIQGGGKTLYDAFKDIIGKGLFKHMEREAAIIVKNVEVFGMDYVSAMSDVAINHPNEGFKNLLLGYTSVLSGGGDLLRYLETKLGDFIEDMKFRWKKYGEDVTTLGEVTLMILFIFPALMLAGSFIMPGESIVILNILTMFGIPMLLILIYLMIASSQPKTYDVVRASIIIPSISAALIGFTLYFLNVNVYVVLASCFAVFAGINGVIVSKQLKEIRMIEEGLPRFLRDITEARKMGFDLNQSIIKVSREVSYNPILDSHISFIAGELRRGVELTSIIPRLRTRSWLEKITLYTIGVGIREGEILPTQLERMIDFVETVNRVKRETKAKLRMQTFLSFIAPIGLAIIVSLMAGVLTYFTGFFSGLLGGAAQAGFIGGQSMNMPMLKGLMMTEPLMQSARALIVVSALGIGILGGKISSLTAKDTTKLFMVMVLTIIALLFSDVIVAQFLRGMIGARA